MDGSKRLLHACCVFAALILLLNACHTKTESSTTIADGIQDIRQETSELMVTLNKIESDDARDVAISINKIDAMLVRMYGDITEQEARIVKYRQAINWLTDIIAIIALIKALGYAVLFSGRKLPRWLDVLI